LIFRYPYPRLSHPVPIIHQTGCLICGGDLEYLDGPEEIRCMYCGELFSTTTRCERGHCVCERCHRLGGENIIELSSIRSTEVDPFEMAIAPDEKSRGKNAWTRTSFPRSCRAPFDILQQDRGNRVKREGDKDHPQTGRAYHRGILRPLRRLRRGGGDGHLREHHHGCDTPFPAGMEALQPDDGTEPERYRDSRRPALLQEEYLSRPQVRCSLPSIRVRGQPSRRGEPPLHLL